MTRQMISVNIVSIDPDGMLLQDFRELDAKYGDEFVSLRIYGEPYGHDGGCDYFLRGERMEHDDEYENRLKVEEQLRIADEKLQATMEAKERKQYEKLKAKYG